MKLSKEDIKKYGTSKELQEMARFSPKNLIFLVFESTQYVESFEDSFLGAFTDGEKAYRAAQAWSIRKRKRNAGSSFLRNRADAYTIYQVLSNEDLSKGQAEDVTQDLEDLYEPEDENDI